MFAKYKAEFDEFEFAADELEGRAEFALQEQTGHLLPKTTQRNTVNIQLCVLHALFFLLCQ